jgi:hypothetical protein
LSETDSFDWLPALLVLQGVLTTVDSFLDPRALKAVRDAVYAALFAAFAWLAWLGAFAWVLGALLAAQVALALLEPAAAPRAAGRRLHVASMLTLGAIVVLLVPVLLDWAANPSELAPAHHGWMTWALSALALSAAFNSFLALSRRAPR